MNLDSELVVPMVVNVILTFAAGLSFMFVPAQWVWIPAVAFGIGVSVCVAIGIVQWQRNRIRKV